MIHLPGLACLNKPVALRPIVEKLPLSPKSKGEKQIMEYAEKHDEGFSPVGEFSRMIQNQARKRNHPNITAGEPSTIGYTESRRAERDRRRPFPQSESDVKRMLKTQLAQENDHRPERGAWHLQRETLFHRRTVHDLAYCQAFSRITGMEKEKWLFKETLCFRCFFPHHLANARKENVKFSIYGSRT